MAGINGDSGVSEDPGPVNGLGQLGSGAADDACFDASQYAFFGKDVLEEVELGGLEDDDNDNVADSVGLGDEEDRFSYLEDRAEGEGLGSLSDVDDLASTFSKLNRVGNEPRRTGVIGHSGSVSRESSSAADWAQEPQFSNWLDQHALEAENVQDGKRWWSQPHPSSADSAESRPLYRASSYPEKQQQVNSSEPIPVPKSSYISYPPPGGLSSQASPNNSYHINHSPVNTGLQMSLSAPSPVPFPNFQLAGVAHGQHHSGNVAQFGSAGVSVNNQQQNLRLNHAPILGDNSSFLPNLGQQQLPRSNGLMPPQMFPPRQHHRMHQVQPSLSHFAQVQSQMFSPHHSPPQMMNMVDPMVGMAELRDQRFNPTYRGREAIGFSQQGFDTGNRKFDNGWPRFRAKYMSAEEIESILRMQHAATHSSDPYVDDYYHQACLAKKSVGSRVKHHFRPIVIRGAASRPRSKDEPHPYLQVDALGRLPFSSIRRPRPLLEVEPVSASSDGILDQKSSVKPLEQEPMLAARIAIEDGLCLLLDVDDIDRLLQFSQPPESVSQLRRRRQAILEGLAASLQLVDPLGPSKTGHSVGLDPKDDLVFLRLVSLPKGRKLLSSYLAILVPGSELARVACMAVFRHLRFLFGSLSTDSSAAETTTNLARTVTSCIHGMDLSALSVCLAAVVCSSEQPPLRPLGSSAGDGASIIIKSVLEKATELLTNHHASTDYSMSIRALWQASFDSFFGLLVKYCQNKYDGIMQSLLLQVPNAAIICSEATKAISREMPVDLLRASLPHTDEHQRKLLLDFAQRSMPVTGYNAHGAGSGAVISESVPS
uniref:protein PAT1 homolog 1-like n=1 Tax=Typha latifolia TaxID=4733 RepID=UPI003C30952F